MRKDVLITIIALSVLFLIGIVFFFVKIGNNVSSTYDESTGYDKQRISTPADSLLITFFISENGQYIYTVEQKDLKRCETKSGFEHARCKYEIVVSRYTSTGQDRETIIRHMFESSKTELMTGWNRYYSTVNGLPVVVTDTRDGIDGTSGIIFYQIDLANKSLEKIYQSSHYSNLPGDIVPFNSSPLYTEIRDVEQKKDSLQKQVGGLQIEMRSISPREEDTLVCFDNTPNSIVFTTISDGNRSISLTNRCDEIDFLPYNGLVRMNDGTVVLMLFYDLMLYRPN